MGLDGIAPPGFMMENIPARIYENGQVEALFNGDDDEDGQSTAGMAYVFVDGRAEFMRTFYAQKVDGRYVDMLELFGTEPPVTLTPEEIAVAGAAYANRTNREALASIAQNLPATATAADSAEPGAGPALPFTPPTAKTTLKDRVLELLADGPMAIKAIRAALPDVAPGSVNNTIGQLHDLGLVIPVSRGTYKLADTQPRQSDDNAIEDELNELLPMAIELVISTQLGSASMLQRKLRIGWDLANALMQALELAGIVGPQDGDKNRPVLVNAEDLEAAIATARQPQ
jgi:DNA segregation ATPase FtsK/SpoIIIE-like protein